MYWDEDTHSPCHGPGIADVTGTADGTYTANEQTLINDLKAALNSALAALRSAGIIAQD
jgi:hypothetical protein